MTNLRLSLQTLLDDDRFESELLDLQLLCGDEPQYTGQGMLAWDAEHGIRIEAITDGASKLLGRGFTTGTRPGELLRANDYLRLSARTQWGDKVCIERLMHTGSQSHANSPHIVWKWSQRDACSPVTFEQAPSPEDLAREPTVEMLLQPLHLPGWPKGSTITDDNPIAYRRIEQSDWLDVTIGASKLIARKQNDTTVRLRVHPIAEEHNSIVGAVRLAFSFLTGKQVGLLATESTDNTGTTLRVYRTTPSTINGFAAPLGHGIELMEEFAPMLAKAVEFFMSQEGVKVASLLGTCWDTVDNTLTTQCAIACAAVEGIIGILKRVVSSDTEKAEFEKFLAKFKDFAKGENKSAEDIERMTGLLGMMRNPQPPQRILKKWSAKGVLGIEDEDAKAWTAIRHPAAHGSSSSKAMEPDELQGNLQCLDRVHNLINKLVLQAMGYDGWFFDYSVWQIKRFPLADSSAL
jgi:hypothetical protein